MFVTCILPQLAINTPSCSRMHHSFTGSSAKCLVEWVTVMLCQIISSKRLAAIFVYPLQNLPRFSADHIVFTLRTLYPAAYPKPGKREVNFLATPSEAYSLKTTVLKFWAVTYLCQWKYVTPMELVSPLLYCSWVVWLLYRQGGRSSIRQYQLSLHNINLPSSKWHPHHLTRT